MRKNRECKSLSWAKQQLVLLALTQLNTHRTRRQSQRSRKVCSAGAHRRRWSATSESSPAHPSCDRRGAPVLRNRAPVPAAHFRRRRSVTALRFCWRAPPTAGLDLTRALAQRFLQRCKSVRRGTPRRAGEPARRCVGAATAEQLVEPQNEPVELELELELGSFPRRSQGPCAIAEDPLKPCWPQSVASPRHCAPRRGSPLMAKGPRGV